MPKPLALPALEPATVPASTGSSYPEPFRAAVAARQKRVLGDALGLTHYGVNLVRLPPGVASAQRHWHTHEDEFVMVLEGELELVSDAGSQRLTPGMVAGFPAGKADGHHLVNRSKADAVYLEVGDRNPQDECVYPDIDLLLKPIEGDYRFIHRDGKPY